MNTISFKMETVIVPCETRKLRVKWSPELAQDLNAMNVYGETKEEPHKILTVKEWVWRKKRDALIIDQIVTSQLKKIEETNKAFDQLQTKVENMSWDDKKKEIDEFIKKEYGYVGKP
jgi:hypothetical protein